MPSSRFPYSFSSLFFVVISALLACRAVTLPPAPAIQPCSERERETVLSAGGLRLKGCNVSRERNINVDNPPRLPAALAILPQQRGDVMFYWMQQVEEFEGGRNKRIVAGGGG
ncbi:hypothetical protein DFP73DRAFT_334198 [Morchella snyderi]|nr:hypothetical protein DFP73DRAFT_334198 [Morchella snyderi]